MDTSPHVEQPSKLAPHGLEELEFYRHRKHDASIILRYWTGGTFCGGDLPKTESEEEEKAAAEKEEEERMESEYEAWRTVRAEYEKLDLKPKIGEQG
ncbi:hypothetical protein N7478_002479 [Penicillium angulare]|uniref:uncharacterized protein n=1 Tax=Penicillium angulare TaxID=116970 RepID=UPI002540437F|nr:uncharacterized protein N7478_002479 [Penicillium angulare]KAJ5286793.1 hypothetical protein N7478_002479 [Penicillium angulare]